MKRIYLLSGYGIEDSTPYAAFTNRATANRYAKKINALRGREWGVVTVIPLDAKGLLFHTDSIGTVRMVTGGRQKALKKLLGAAKELQEFIKSDERDAADFLKDERYPTEPGLLSAITRKQMAQTCYDEKKRHLAELRNVRKQLKEVLRGRP